MRTLLALGTATLLVIVRSSKRQRGNREERTAPPRTPRRWCRRFRCTGAWRRALRYAVREQEFLTVFSAGLTLVVIGTVSYALGEGWNVVDALYFAVATLTTTSVSDPNLVLDERWMKLFTVFYLLIGIGILVEILRRLGIAFVAVRAQEREPDQAPPE